LFVLQPCFSSKEVKNNFYFTDGAWGEWSDWDTCTATCGGGTQTHIRYCDSPPPSDGGIDCGEDFTETQVCNTESCVTGKFLFFTIQFIIQYHISSLLLYQKGIIIILINSF